jgi:hypothetical protein
MWGLVTEIQKRKNTSKIMKLVFILYTSFIIGKMYNSKKPEILERSNNFIQFIAK